MTAIRIEARSAVRRLEDDIMAVACALGDTSPAAAAFARIVERLCRLASGIETEGHDHEDGHGAKHESPARKGTHK